MHPYMLTYIYQFLHAHAPIHAYFNTHNTGHIEVTTTSTNAKCCGLEYVVAVLMGGMGGGRRGGRTNEREQRRMERQRR
jgi:hypothetical protein